MSQATAAPKTTKSVKADREPIPVATIKSHAPTPFDFPGASLTSSVSSVKQGNRQGSTISYLPWMRHFRISYNDGNRTHVSMIHETQVASWTPAE